MRQMVGSATVAMNSLAKSKRQKGERVFNLAAGDPVIENHPRIIQRAVERAQKGESPYPPFEGIPELRSLTADWVNGSCGSNYQKENVLVTCGGKFALFSLVYSLLQKDDEVLIPAPYWVSYPDIVNMAGGTPVIVNSSSQNGWKITGEDLYRVTSSRSKLLILNNACNPTGVLYDREELRDLLAAAKRLGLIVISDEVYSGLVYDGRQFVSCGSFPEYRDRVMLVQSCSKNFAMAGWRVGFVLGSESVIRRLSILQTQTTNGTPFLSQWAAVGALEHAEEVNGKIREAMEGRRNLFMQTFQALFGVTLGPIPSALYAWIPLPLLGMEDCLDSTVFCEEILASDNIAMVPGKAFGTEGYVRCAYSEREEEIVLALEALYKGVGRLQGRAA